MTDISFFAFEPWQYVLVAAVAIGASVLGGIAGYGTGLLLPPILIPLIGPEAVVPVIGVSVASFGYGLINGGTAGSGVVLLSILLSAGLSGVAVIATDAGISITLGIIKSLTFAANGALGWGSMCMALLIGISALPGAFIAKALAYRMDGKLHILILDAIVILGGSFLIYRGLAA